MDELALLVGVGTAVSDDVDVRVVVSDRLGVAVGAGVMVAVILLLSVWDKVNDVDDEGVVLPVARVSVRDGDPVAVGAGVIVAVAERERLASDALRVTEEDAVGVGTGLTVGVTLGVNVKLFVAEGGDRLPERVPLAVSDLLKVVVRVWAGDRVCVVVGERVGELVADVVPVFREADSEVESVMLPVAVGGRIVGVAVEVFGREVEGESVRDVVEEEDKLFDGDSEVVATTEAVEVSLAVAVDTIDPVRLPLWVGEEDGEPWVALGDSVELLVRVLVPGTLNVEVKDCDLEGDKVMLCDVV